MPAWQATAPTTPVPTTGVIHSGAVAELALVASITHTALELDTDTNTRLRPQSIARPRGVPSGVRRALTPAAGSTTALQSPAMPPPRKIMSS